MRLCRKPKRCFLITLFLFACVVFMSWFRVMPFDPLGYKLLTKNTVKHRTPFVDKSNLREKHGLEKKATTLSPWVRMRDDLDKPFDKEYPVPDNFTEIEKYYNLSRGIITPLNYKVLSAHSNFCSKNPFMIKLIPSSPENIELRRAIRLTHGRYGRDEPVYSVDTNTPVEICTVFVIGLGNNTAVNRAVLSESYVFKDIILAEFVDSYYNLTLKLLLGLKWISENSPGVKYVLKADDDVFVHMQLLMLQIIRYHWNDNGCVFGTLMGDKLRVVYEGKWGVNNKTEYPLKFFPPYAQGTSYTLTGNLISKIVNTAQHLPYLHIEDAFITGIIAYEIHGANLIHILRSSDWSDHKPTPCSFILDRRVAQTKMTPALMLNIWDYLQVPNVCLRRVPR